jgi:YVTN family beta-propeller protein
VARERGEKLQVVLGITAPELAVMPWEALYDGELGGYLCRKEDLVRRIDAPFTPDPLPVRPPLRILAIVASPRGLPELDVDAEQQNLEKALARPVSMGQVQLEWETQASWSSVHDRLLQEKWHVLHFIGHGDYDPERDVGRIALVGDDGRAEWVDAISLADLLGEAEPTPRVVVLNSCASGQSGSNDLFSGTAAALVRSGICAVAAMQFSVSDFAAVRFPRGFYAALASGRRVDEAVRSGRIEIIGAGSGTLEWVTPILHIRGEATELFQLVGPAPPAPTTGEPAGERRDPAPESPDRPETRAADGSPRTTPEPPVAPTDVVTPAAPVGDRAGRALRPTEAPPPGRARRRPRWTPRVVTATCTAVALIVIGVVIGIWYVWPPQPTVTPVGVGHGPYGVAVDPDTRTVWVTNKDDDTASVINATDNSVQVAKVGDHPRGVAVDSATHTAWVASREDGKMSVVDNTGRTLASFPIGKNPNAVAVDDSTRTAWVTDSSVKMLYLVNTISHVVTPVAFDAAPQFRMVAVDSASRTAWITNADDSVSMIDMPSRTVTATIKVGRNPYGVAVDATTRTAWVANSDENSVSVIDATSRTVTDTVKVGRNPYGVAVDSSTHTAWVTNIDDGTVSMIDTISRAVTDTVTVGGEPYGVVVDAKTHLAWVANMQDRTVSVIAP